MRVEQPKIAQCCHELLNRNKRQTDRQTCTDTSWRVPSLPIQRHVTGSSIVHLAIFFRLLRRKRLNRICWPPSHDVTVSLQAVGCIRVRGRYPYLDSESTTTRRRSADIGANTDVRPRERGRLGQSVGVRLHRALRHSIRRWFAVQVTSSDKIRRSVRLSIECAYANKFPLLVSTAAGTPQVR